MIDSYTNLYTKSVNWKIVVKGNYVRSTRRKLMKNYELLTVFKPNLDAEEVDKACEALNKNIVDFGGKVESTDKTGRKKLAYDIQNFRDGFFVTTTFSLPEDKVAEFKRQLRLNDNVLRTMFLAA